MRIAESELRTALQKLFVSAGLAEENAAVVTHCLMEAELAGIGTHGVAMTEAHLKKCRDGYDIGASLTVETEKPAFAVCHAHNMIGMLSAWQAMGLAVEKARESGMYAVFCHHANTFSAAYCYVKYAAEQGMISYVSCNSPAQMAPWGGREKLLGTNPLAVGIPARHEKPFLFDMATSAVAKSKINQALHNGDATIPFGWATDGSGQPTNDPKEAVKGLILPMAGPKGYGLSMAIDMMAGLLSHAAYLDGVGRFYSDDNACMNVGHMMVVIDPKTVYGESFYDEADAYLKRVRESAAAPAGTAASGNAVMAPGDINEAYRQDALTNGVELPERVVASLNRLLEEIGEEPLSCRS